MSSVSDDFNRADQNPIAGNWGPEAIGNALQIVSNKVRGTASDQRNYSFWNALTPKNDQWVQARIVTYNATSGTKTCGPSIRRITTAETFYWFGPNVAGTFSGSMTILLEKLVAGSGTTLASGSAAISANDFLRLQGIRNDLQASIAGVVVLTASDSSIQSGRLALYIGNSDTVASVEFDDWNAGDFSTEDYSKFPKMVISDAVQRGWLY